jgi:hypothetical protein
MVARYLRLSKEGDTNMRARGLTGACNMTNPNAAFGMFEVAGSVANPHGFEEGMITAILNTNGGTVPDNCGG